MFNYLKKLTAVFFCSFLFMSFADATSNSSLENDKTLAVAKRKLGSEALKELAIITKSIGVQRIYSCMITSRALNAITASSNNTFEMQVHDMSDASASVFMLLYTLSNSALKGGEQSPIPNREAQLIELDSCIKDPQILALVRAVMKSKK